MVFCNVAHDRTFSIKHLRHNPYFSRWFSAIIDSEIFNIRNTEVTILILVDGFLQYHNAEMDEINIDGHNPYFSRWFSAMKTEKEDKVINKYVTILILVDGFLQ